MMLSPSSKATLEALDAYIRAHGYAPSMRELADLIGAQSSNTAWWHVRRLAEAGMVTAADRRRARTCRITERGRAELRR